MLLIGARRLHACEQLSAARRLASRKGRQHTWRANGEGSIRKHKDGRWNGQYTARHDPEAGKTIYKNLLTKGRVDRQEAKGQSKGLSAKTVRNIHQILSSVLKLAREQRILPTNPVEGCALSKVEHREMKNLPVENSGLS